MEKRISKKIHYCWFGNNKKNKLIKKCINSWKKYCSDYEIIEWNEKNFNVNINKYTQQAYETKKWAFVSDYARLWIVYNFGGIYLDTDVELVKPLDNLLKYDAFFASEKDNSINTGLGFGAKKGNNLVKTIMDSYENIDFMIKDKQDLTPCPIRNTKSIENFYNIKVENLLGKKINNVYFLTKEFFSPYNSSTGEMNKTKNTFGIHWYQASWRSKKINAQRFILRPIKRIVGMETFEKIKSFMKNENKH